MSELRPDAEALFEAARADDRAPAGEDERLRQLFNARLGAAAAAAAVPTAAAATTTGTVATVTKVVLGVVLLGGAGAVTWRVSQPRPMPAVAPVSVAAPAEAAPETEAVEPDEIDVDAPAPARPRPHRHPTVHAVTRPHATPVAAADPPPSEDTLKREVELITRAQTALNENQPARALELLDAHAATFPHGTLTQERAAARVLALCSLGRIDEARRAAQAFLQEAQSSPLAARVRHSCAFEPKP